MAIQFKRKYVELTVREQKLIFSIISSKELTEMVKDWRTKFGFTLGQLQAGNNLTVDILDEMTRELHSRYEGEEELTLEELSSLSADEIGFMFGAISHVQDKNQIDPKVRLK